MPTTPIGANNILRLFYHAAGVNHILNLRCGIVYPYTVGEVPTIQAFSGVSHDLPAGDVLTALLPSILEFYLSTDEFTRYQVWDMTTSPPTFVYEQGLTGYIGTHTGEQHQKASYESTFNFRDRIGKRVKIPLFGTTFSDLGRETTHSGKVFHDFVVDMTGAVAETSGDYFSGRSGNQIQSWISTTTQANNALESKILYG